MIIKRLLITKVQSTYSEAATPALYIEHVKHTAS